MPVRQYKPTTPGRRKSSVLITKDLAAPVKKGLLRGSRVQAGRAQGQITVRHRGGGAKKLYRTVDFNQRLDIPATVAQIEYDPFRTANIALLKYADGDYRYVIAEATMKAGQPVEAGAKAKLARGNRTNLGRIPAGTAVYNISLTPTSAGTIVRTAGGSAQLMGHESGETLLRLPSGEVRRVLSVCYANIGVVGNSDHQNVRVGKAGRSRHLGRRPHVRGKAMNPVDHPHGGGEGANPIGLKGPKTPSGFYTLGRKTRKRQVPKSIVRRRGGR